MVKKVRNMENKTNNKTASADKQKKDEIEKLKKELIKKLPKLGEPCVLDPDVSCTHCGECLLCDLDPTKFCDNCGKCLDTYNTDEKGYVSIKIDKIITDPAADQMSLEELLKSKGLDFLNNDDDE